MVRAPHGSRGVFRSADHGASWIPINNGITNLSIYALTSGSNGSGGTNLYCAYVPDPGAPVQWTF